MTWLWILIAIALLGLIALALWRAASRRRRRAHLRDRFGTEYDTAVDQRGSRRRGEAELEAREERRQALDIRPLPAGARERYRESWATVQARFVDRPPDAVAEADTLVAEVMRERGYPLESFEQQAADVSVDHPHVVENYRAAHAIAEKDQSKGRASTEELRQAMVHYRSLFEELLGEKDESGRQSDGQRAPAESSVAGSRPVVREEARTRRIDDDEAEETGGAATPPGATTNRRGPE